MGSKSFLFTDKEVALLKNPKKVAIVLTGETWEQAWRFMVTTSFGNLTTDKNPDGLPKGFTVSWIEKGQFPEELIDAFNTTNAEIYDEEFLELSIKYFRKKFRENYAKENKKRPAVS